MANTNGSGDLPTRTVDFDDTIDDDEDSNPWYQFPVFYWFKIL